MSETDPKSFWALNRSVLALGRTAISMIILGFVLEKFDFFLQELSLNMPASSLKVLQENELFYHTLGLITTFSGILLALFTVFYYKQQLRFLKEGITKDNELFFYVISYMVAFFGIVIFTAMIFL